MKQPILSVKQLSVAFGRGASRTLAVDRVEFTLFPGECMALVGESGSGKTLTALSIIQLLPFAACVSNRSQVWLGQSDLLTFSERQMRGVRGRRIGMIFQDAMSAFNPVLTVGKQIVEVLRLHLRIGGSVARQKALALLREVGIRHPERYFQAYPHELSGGMRQRAMIALAIAAEPELLIADEPTTALDVTLQAQIIRLLVELKETRQVCILFISHDLAVVSALADRVTVLVKGKLVEQATKAQFFSGPTDPYSQSLLAAVPDLKPALTKPAVNASPLLTIDQMKVYFPLRTALLHRRVGFIKAVDGISLTISKGRTLALVGESGSGKTTVAKALVQLVKSSGGQVILDGVSLSAGFSRRTALSEQVQIIFQDAYAALNPRLMIAQSVAEGLLANRLVSNSNELQEKIDELLVQVKLSPEMKWRYPHECSGGQRQRICIARALALTPKLLILDEPTSALDVTIQAQLLTLLSQLQTTHQITYLLITHNLSVVAQMAHDVAVMYQGKIVEVGSTFDILTCPKAEYTKKLLADTPVVMTNTGTAH